MNRIVSLPARYAFVVAVFVFFATTTVNADAGGGGSSSKLGEVNKAIKKEDYNAAIEELVRLNTEEVGDADVLNLLGYSHRKLGDFDKALEYYQQALDVDPKHKGAHEYLGELYLQTSQLEKAEEQLAILDDICLLTCGEYRDLKKSIKKYKQNQ
jgi:tetratricopeptide (TPR) repeat protein